MVDLLDIYNKLILISINRHKNNGIVKNKVDKEFIGKKLLIEINPNDSKYNFRIYGNQEKPRNKLINVLDQ